MNKKRALAVSLTAGVLTLLSSPAAHALRRDDGDDPGTGLSVAETLGLFVAAPLLLFGLIAAAVVLSERR